MKTRFGMRALPLLLVMLLVGAAVPAVSAYTATDSAYRYMDGNNLVYGAETTLSQPLEIYIQATLWKDGSGLESTPMMHTYSNQLKAKGERQSPISGTYKTKGYRCVIEGGIQDKNWFESSTLTL